MRRLIAYLTLTITLIFGAALNTLTPLRSLVSNHEYQSGREFVYRISDKENPDNVFTDQTAVDAIAATMDRRMQNFGVSEYNIAKEGNNIIRTTTTLQSDEEYRRLQVYLNYNANFTIRIGDDDNTEAELSAAEVFKDVKARVEYRGPYPFIIFPLSDPELFQTNIVNVAEKIQEEQGGEAQEGEDRPALVKKANIVLWSDYNADKDSYEDPQGDSKGKIFLSFDFRSMWWNEKKTEIGVASPLEGASEGQTNYTTAQIKKASDTARYMANVFNAGTLDYKVEFLFQNQFTDPSVEAIINLNNRDNLALSATLFASVIAYLLVTVIAFAIYRLPIINALSSGLLTFLGTMIIFNAIQVEFSTSAIVGLLIVSLVSLVSTLIYAGKFRNEVYKGRSFKKAHNEAIVKSSFMTGDILILMLITGVFTYFFGGAALAGFAATLIFGSIVMLVSVLLHNAVILPLLAFNRISSKSYAMYGINESKVPNPLNDEKQTYFGRFMNHKPESKAKLNAIALGSLGVVGAILVLVFGAFTSINPYNLVKYDSNTTRVYFQVSERSDISSNSSLNNPLILLSYIELDGESLPLIKKDGAPVYETHAYKVLEEQGEVEVEVTYNFYVYSLKGRYTGEETVSFKTTADGVRQEGALSDALDEIVKSLDENATISFNAVQKESVNPHFGRVALVALVALSVTSLYFALRFGLTRGITNFIESFVAGALVMLFFMASRLAIPPLATMGVFVAILFVSFLNVIIFSSIKEVEHDTQTKGMTRKEMYSLGLQYTLSLLYILTLVFSVTFLIFTLLGPLAVSSVYLGAIIAVILGLLIVTKFNTLSLSTSLNILARLPRKARKQKLSKEQRTSIKPRSGEPEEAVFIGIND